MSFILDALRKSEHERQRSALPSLAQVPVATPPAQLPRWVVIVMALLVTAVVALGIAWFRSAQAPGASPRASAPATVERRVELPPAPAARAPAAIEPPAILESAASIRTSEPARAREQSLAALAAPQETPAGAAEPPESGEPALPSAAALAARGVALPPLRLELHAFSESPADRFVFINGRKYAEGERLPEGPELVSIEPRGAVLRHAGQRFLLVPE